MTKEKLAVMFLRLGLAFVFFYAAIAALLDPFSWVGFFPQWMRSLIPDNLLLPLHSASEIILALWLLSEWKTLYASLAGTLAIFAIVVFNIGALDIIFRDVGLFFAALALVILSKQET